jgi:hypothetical protein
MSNMARKRRDGESGTHAPPSAAPVAPWRTAAHKSTESTPAHREDRGERRPENRAGAVVHESAWQSLPVAGSSSDLPQLMPMNSVPEPPSQPRQFAVTSALRVEC